MSFEPRVNIDGIKKALAYQYSESQNLIDYIEVLLTPFDELEQVFADILNKRLIDDPGVTTNALDTYGVILDQPRESYDATSVLFFGLDADDINNPVTHDGLGDLNDPSEGGMFRSVDQPVALVTRLQNNDYKLVLKGKEHQNNFKGGVEALIEAIKEVLEITDSGSFEVVEDFTTPSDPVVRIDFKVTLSNLQIDFMEILDVLPKPGGIRYEYTYI